MRGLDLLKESYYLNNSYIDREFIDTLDKEELIKFDAEQFQKAYEAYAKTETQGWYSLPMLPQSPGQNTTNTVTIVGGPTIFVNGVDGSVLPKKKFFAGVGSETVPIEIYERIVRFSKRMAELGWHLRSGGANGCDAAFELGYAEYPDKKEIFLPWKGFNKHPSELYHIIPEAFVLAEKHHPNWKAVVRKGDAARKLLARDVYQVLGYDLVTPSELVVCWTPDGKEIGGTAQAIRIAKAHNIRVLNLATIKV